MKKAITICLVVAAVLFFFLFIDAFASEVNFRWSVSAPYLADALFAASLAYIIHRMEDD